MPTTMRCDSLQATGRSEQNTAAHTQSHSKSFLARGSRFFKLTLQCSLCALSPKCSSPRAHVMFRTLFDPALTSPSQSAPTSPSLLFLSHWPTTSCPQSGLLFGRFAEQSPLTPRGHRTRRTMSSCGTHGTIVRILLRHTKKTSKTSLLKGRKRRHGLV